MTQLDLFPTAVHLGCIDPAAGKRRRDALFAQCTLFGEWALVRGWGRVGVSSRLRSDLDPSAGRALDALRELAQQKARRGYEPVAAN